MAFEQTTGPVGPSGKDGGTLANSPGQIRLRLLDSQGRNLKIITSGHHNQGRYTIREDLSGLKPGSYLIQIEHGLIKETQKLIKIR